MKKVLIVLLGVVFAFVVFVATRPATYHIERSATIAAPPSMVYAHVENVRMWEAWSPWEELDPEMEKTYEGPESGVGAGYAWAGNDQVGVGRAIIIEAEPNEKVVSDLEFIKPWESKSVTTYALAPAESGTRITWSMDGSNDFMGKAMSIFMNMDQMIGADFEKGLASLKKIAEAEAAAMDTAATSAAP
jgi:uncharacterized protein YndB with AHSA1/START domain